MSEKSKKTEAPTKQTKPTGQILRLAREEKNWSMTDIAKRLNLTNSTIEIMETDGYANNHLDVYHRGYLRLYCGLVGQDASALIETLKNNGFSLEDAFDVQIANHRDPKPEWSIQLNPALKYLLISAGAIALLALFWFKPVQTPKAIEKTVHFQEAKNPDPANNTEDAR